MSFMLKWHDNQRSLRLFRRDPYNPVGKERRIPSPYIVGAFYFILTNPLFFEIFPAGSRVEVQDERFRSRSQRPVLDT